MYLVKILTAFCFKNSARDIWHSGITETPSDDKSVLKSGNIETEFRSEESWKFPKSASRFSSSEISSNSSASLLNGFSSLSTRSSKSSSLRSTVDWSVGSVTADIGFSAAPSLRLLVRIQESSLGPVCD